MLVIRKEGRMSRPITRRTMLAASIASIAIASGRADAQEATPDVSPAAMQGDQSMTITASKELVRAEIDALYNQRDDGVRYEIVRIFADGNLVVVHGRETGLAPEPRVLFTLYRIERGAIVERRDGLQLESGPNPSGRTMLDGPTDVSAPEQTEASRAVVEGFIDALIAGERERIPEFIGDAYLQHNPNMADGLAGMAAAVEAYAKQGIQVKYLAREQTVAEGEFVFVLARGGAGAPVTFYDLFRVEGGKIVEHWDVIA
jgi:predicted SnoaL-like aldol condensation-catalyzing enzyme